MSEPPPSYPPPPPGGYGAAPPPGGYGYQPPPRAVGTNGMAIASLVCAVFGWFCLIGSILGLIFGFIALGQIKRTGQGGRGLAIAGMVVGAAGLVLCVGWMLLYVGMKATHSLAPATVVAVAAQPIPASFGIT